MLPVLVVLLILLSGASSKKIPSHLAESWNNLLKPYEVVCTKENKLSPEITKTIFTGDHIPKEQDIPCYFECTIRKLRILLPNGEFDEEMITAATDYSTAETARNCWKKYNSETNLCTKSYEVVLCVFEASEDH